VLSIVRREPISPDVFADIRAKLNQGRVDFLRIDLSICFTFADLAATMFAAGNRESAEQAIADAEKGYEMMYRFFSDPKQVAQLRADEIVELTSELKRLRQRLDGFHRQR